jgi:intracellular sulfur oxidation DsrE/DsrF family protein
MRKAFDSSSPSCIYVQMKKNGIPPSEFTCRSLFEGMYRWNLDPVEHKGMIEQVKNIFEDLKSTWLAALKPERSTETVADNSEIPKESSTARSYRLAMLRGQENMRSDPGPFLNAINFFVRFLCSVKQEEEAISLVKESQTFTALQAKGKGKGRTTPTQIAPQLPILLAQRFQNELLGDSLKRDNISHDSLVEAWQIILKGLRDESVLSTLRKNQRWLGDEREFDRFLIVGMKSLELVSEVPFVVPFPQQIPSLNLLFSTSMIETVQCPKPAADSNGWSASLL